MLFFIVTLEQAAKRPRASNRLAKQLACQFAFPHLGRPRIKRTASWSWGPGLALPAEAGWPWCVASLTEAPFPHHMCDMRMGHMGRARWQGLRSFRPLCSCSSGAAFSPPCPPRCRAWNLSSGASELLRARFHHPRPSQPTAALPPPGAQEASHLQEAQTLLHFSLCPGQGVFPKCRGAQPTHHHGLSEQGTIRSQPGQAPSGPVLLCPHCPKPKSQPRRLLPPTSPESQVPLLAAAPASPFQSPLAPTSTGLPLPKHATQRCFDRIQKQALKASKVFAVVSRVLVSFR